jgi:hypothetical protein
LGNRNFARALPPLAKEVLRAAQVSTFSEFFSSGVVNGSEKVLADYEGVALTTNGSLRNVRRKTEQERFDSDPRIQVA